MLSFDFYLLISGLGYLALVVFQTIKHFLYQKQAAGTLHKQQAAGEAQQQRVERTLPDAVSTGINMKCVLPLRTRNIQVTCGADRLFFFLNAVARTTIDQINEGNVQNPIGDEPLVHNLPLLDQVPLQVQSIPNECAQLLQSYITGKVGLEPWKAMDIDEALPVCTEAQFLFPDY